MTLENASLNSGEPGPRLALLHHGVRFVEDLPLDDDGCFFPFIERETTRQRSSGLTVEENFYWITRALPWRLIPFL